ncbi:guanylate kinase [Orientia chuto str. Dubai]|uniref:Guanylate kinase n=1 Tax=Orientia chuto str. Dubai TaxID=1359168 RepID=A0A0F3MNE4_9RICK|nr:guanylate kinase [Candidatus Orientia mediorientalis]KJV56099.1 guanylate kinase [Orientia chuto str. Dubai]
MFVSLSKPAIVLIISSPSGAGKSSLAQAIIRSNSNIKFSVSMTTREKRNNEIDGKDYIFVTKEQFEKSINDNIFLEFVKIFNHYYGIPKSEVLKDLNQGQSIIFDINWQGARTIRKVLQSYAVISVYILPPSIQELENRLKKRNKDSLESIYHRLEQAKEDIQHYNEYDYVIVNDNFDQALIALQSILIAEQLKLSKIHFKKDYKF